MKSNNFLAISAAFAVVLATLACSLSGSQSQPTTEPDYIFEEVTTPLVFEPATLPNAQVGADYVVEISVSDNVTPLNSVDISDGALPAGLELVFIDGEDGAKISGTPQEAGTFTFTVFVSCMGTMVSGQTGEMEYQIVVDADPSSLPASGLPVSFNNITFEIPLELNASAMPSLSTAVEFPYINPGSEPMPEHVVFQLTNFPAGDASIAIFKASDYAAYGVPLQEAVTALLAKQDGVQPLADPLTQGEFFAQAKPVNFKNGHGVRQLTQVLMNFAPITNEGLLYFYQGITDDGAYFVSAVIHVNAGFLAANGSMDSVTPSDGIPFSFDGGFDFPAYLSAMTQKLNDTPAESFSPSLSALDRMIESIQITPP